MGSQKPNTGEHIDEIVNMTTCLKHNAPQGVGCFEIRYDGDRRGPAVCGSRIRLAGFNGKIHPSSLSRTAGRK